MAKTQIIDPAERKEVADLCHDLILGIGLLIGVWHRCRGFGDSDFRVAKAAEEAADGFLKKSKLFKGL